MTLALSHACDELRRLTPNTGENSGALEETTRVMSPTREARAHQPVVIRILVSRIHYDKHCESARLCDSLMKGATGAQCCWCADLLRTVRGGGSRLGVLR